MRRLLHHASIQYALALWLATVLALLISFVVQLEPAQWSAITVWIIFMQTPRMNYSKIIWWVFGTVVGALTAVLLITAFCQAPDFFLGALALVLGAWAALSTLVKSYKAYGFVLAGYTCGIVTMSAIENPAMVFTLAVTRVSCILIGMASAVFMMGVLLHKRGHWRETVHHLEEHLRSTLLQVAQALTPEPGPHHFSWRHTVDRLSTLEHTLDITTAESPESRLRAAQARSLTATLFCLLAKAQSVEMHLSHRGLASLPVALQQLIGQTQAALSAFAGDIAPEKSAEKARQTCVQMERLRAQAGVLREILPATVAGQAEEISDRFVLERVDEILEEFVDVMQDWAGLFGPWTARRPARLEKHRDYRTAFIYGLRMVLGIALVSALCFITAWPSGSQLILFMSIVCSLLSLVDNAPSMGAAFLKSALFCFLVAFVETFWILQRAEGFPLLAFVLGIFLVPAAYAYRHPQLTGSAVVSMLIFYGLTNPANHMNYDIVAFLNNGLALLCAACCGFFVFHAVPSLTPSRRRFWVLHSVRTELSRAELGGGNLAEESWTSRMFDRLRLVHLADARDTSPTERLVHENEALIGLQLGLRQIRLRELLSSRELAKPLRADVTAALRSFGKICAHPETVGHVLRATCARWSESVRSSGQRWLPAQLEALAEMKEMIFLIETAQPFYGD